VCSRKGPCSVHDKGGEDARVEQHGRFPRSTYTAVDSGNWLAVFVLSDGWPGQQVRWLELHA